MSNSTKQAIHNAVWRGDINQQFTADIAKQYSVSTPVALRILTAIVNGTSGDARFVANPDSDMGGVLIEGGKVFTHSAVEVANTSKTKQHYVWFLT